MTVKEKLKAAEASISKVLTGKADLLHCEFCQKDTVIHEGVLLCCVPMAEMVAAICDHVELKDQVKAVERVLDRLSSNRYEIQTFPKVVLS